MTTARCSRRLVASLSLAAVVVAGCSSGGPAGDTRAATATSDTVAEVAPGATSPPGTPSTVSTSTDPSAGGGLFGGAGSRCAPASDGTPRAVRVWAAFGGDEAPDTFAALVDEFNGRGGDESVELVRVDRPTELLARLQYTPLADWPDVVVTSPQSMRRLVDTGRLVAPQECAGVAGLDQAVDDLLPAVETAYRYDGAVRGVPLGVSSTVLFFDAAEFRAAGLDPADPPVTLDELASASERIVASGASPNGLVLYEWYGAYLLHGAAVQDGTVVLSPGNGRMPGEIEVAYARREAIEVLEWLQAMVADHGGVAIGRTPSSVEDLLRVVDPVDGATMTLHSSASLGDVLALVDAGAFPGVELGVGPLPGRRAGAEVGGVGMWLLDRGDPTAVAAAAAVAAWFAAPEQMARFAAATGYVPAGPERAAHPVIVEHWERVPQMRVAYDQLVGVPPGLAAAGPLVGPNAEMNSRLFDLTLAVLDGADPTAALTAFERDVSVLMEDYERLLQAYMSS